MDLRLRQNKWTVIFPLLLGLALFVACGTAAPDPADPPAQETPPSADGTPAPTSQPSPASPNGVTPAGAINVGLPELGTFGGHPSIALNPALTVSHSAPVGEGLMYLDINRELQGWLLESWSVSGDFTTWTLNLRQGVQFHRGYGEMTAEDMIWSYAEGWTQNDIHSRVSEIRDFWAHPEGYVEAPDPYTVIVNTGAPLSAAIVQERWMASGPTSHWVASKRQEEEIGIEATNREPALTGPWEMVEHRTGQFWRMRAVDGHWRQTPYFQELVFWELQEESARLAGFQTGHLDTFTMAIDSIPLVESIPGAKLMRVPGGPEYALQIFGNYHVEALAGNPPAAFNPELPWISASADLDSDEWQRAVKVRQALIMAIDREAIIETILGGNARPGILWFWSLHADRLGDRSWEYNPERARELLAEAGYPGGGFSITLSPTIRAAPSEVELCEAIATMWDNELGLRVRLERIPFSVFAAQRAARTYVGATCHATSPRMVVGAQAGLTTLGAANFGATHPFLEEITPRIASAVDDTERERLEDEMGAFLFDNALTTIGLFDADTIWPVGPNIEEWREHVKTKDVLRINGYEYIQPRR